MTCEYEDRIWSCETDSFRMSTKTSCFRMGTKNVLLTHKLHPRKLVTFSFFGIPPFRCSFPLDNWVSSVSQTDVMWTLCPGLLAKHLSGFFGNCDSRWDSVRVGSTAPSSTVILRCWHWTDCNVATFLSVTYWAVS